jgi:hypothetical protein
MEFGSGGRTVMARKQGPWEVSRPRFDARSVKKFRLMSGVAQNQIVPMHHFGAAGDAQNKLAVSG